MKEFNLPTVPLFYFGKWKDEKFFYNLTKKPNIEGIIVRPIYEDRLNYKRVIVKFSNKPKFDT